MALFPKVKLKAVVSFPATVLDGVGVDTVRQNGAYQFNLAFDDFAPPLALVPDPPHQNALLWNSVTGVYSLVPISIIATGGAVPEAPNDGTVYGRKSTTWVDAWANPTFTGDPKAPTPAPGDNDTSVATTAFVNGAIAATVMPSNANPAMNGIAAPGVVLNYSRGDHVHPSDTSRAPLASPIFTGDPRAPTPAPGDNDTSIATTAFVTASFAPLASPTFIGDPKAPTPPPGDNDTSIATTAFVTASLTGFITDAPSDGTQYGRQFQSGAMTWTPVVGGGGGTGTGDVTGPAGAVADHIATYNGTTGKVIKDGGVPISALSAAPAALTRTNDTNVTLTLGGLPNTALLQATSITVGWTGTLQASRGGFGVDVSAAAGVPLFAAGVPAFIGTTGTLNFARANSPVFTGDPQAPTPTAGDNDTSIATTAFVAAAIAAAPVMPGPPTGRLTLVTGVPVMSTTTTGINGIYYTPYNGPAQCPLYNGTSFVATPFVETYCDSTDATKNPAVAVAAKCYDLFAWNDAGTFRVSRGPAWPSDLSRGTGAGTSQLIRVGGVQLNQFAITNGPAAQRGTFLGTMRTRAADMGLDFIRGTAASGGGAAWVGLSNYYNRRLLGNTIADTVANWTYAGTTWRAADNSVGNRISWVDCSGEDAIDAVYTSFGSRSGVVNAMVGIGVDTLTAFSGTTSGILSDSTQSTPCTGAYRGNPGIGFHFASALENANAATASFYGSAGVPLIIQTGMNTSLWF